MKTRVYWKIAATYLLAAALTLGALGAYLMVEVRDNAREALRDDVRVQAFLARDVVRERIKSGQAGADLRELATQLGRAAGCRVTLIAGDGTVLADNEHDSATMLNHNTRPEVLAARREGFGAATRRSDTLGIDFYYVAVPVEPSGQEATIVRLAVPMTEVAAAGGPVRHAVLMGLLLAVVLVCGLSLWLARGIVRPLDEVGRAARGLASGDLAQRARVYTGDEIQRLAETFNSMADRLGTTLTELGAAQANREAILANMADGVIVTDANGVVTLFNRASEELLGVRAGEAIGHGIHEAAIHFELGEMVAQCLATGAAERAELRVERPAARVLDVAVSAMTGGSGSPSGAIVVLHDLTALRRLENVRREFVANVSHELRTPVAAVRSLVETLPGAIEDDPEAARQFLRELLQQTERLTALLDDLLELSRLDSGRRELRREAVDVRATVEAAAAKLAPAARGKGHTVRNDTPEGLTVWADSGALERVMVNLLDNAVRYAPAGGLIIVSATPEEDAVVIAVTDDGPGIPEADQPRIFERFYRVDRARSRELGGTGLGLSIVKHIVESHGGEVSVVSKLGEGTTFHVRLPKADGTAAGSSC